MSTCPYCGAEIRPGDNFCLSCGKPLAVPNAPSASEAEEATMLGSPLPVATPNANQQQDSGYEGATMMAPPHGRTVENPGHFVLSSYRGKEIQNGTSYGLDKVVTTIGRAPENDIVLLDEGKVISRYHATVRYENGTYQLIDNGSSNGTSVNGQQVDKQLPRPLQDGDHVTVGDYELVYYAPISVSSEATMIGISPAQILKLLLLAISRKNRTKVAPLPGTGIKTGCSKCNKQIYNLPPLCTCRSMCQSLILLLLYRTTTMHRNNLPFQYNPTRPQWEFHHHRLLFLQTLPQE